jgi:hypothetical protein
MPRPAKRRNPKGAKRWGLANLPAVETPPPRVRLRENERVSPDRETQGRPRRSANGGDEPSEALSDRIASGRIVIPTKAGIHSLINALLMPAFAA